MIRKKTIPSAPMATLMPVLLASMLLNCATSKAAETSLSAQYTIEQPAQPVADALRSIAHETSTSVLFEPGAVRGRIAHRVSGHLSAFEAIKAALQGTGLVAEQINEGAVVVRLPAAAGTGPASGAPASA